MSNLPGAAIKQIQCAGNRRPVSLHELDQHFHPLDFLESLRQAAPPVEPACAYPGKPQPARKQRSLPVLQEPAAIWKVSTRTTDSGDFEVALLICESVRWSTIASYTCRSGRARRCIHYANGDRQPCLLDLPPLVVLEMAREDFTRNWLGYYREYLYEPRERSRFPGCK